jgi:hypothetical protein
MEPADGVTASVSSGVVGYILHHPSVLMPERNDTISPEYALYLKKKAIPSGFSMV